MSFTLRPYQERCIDEIQKTARLGTTRQLIVMATGLGKTVIVAKLLQGMEWPRTFGVMHREELLNQATQTIRTIDGRIPIGIEKAGSSADPAQDRVILASVQTVGRRDKTRLSAISSAWPSIVWLDEAHHAPAGSWLTVVDHFGLHGDQPRRDALLIGTTATPDRLDELGYDKIFDDVVFRYGLREAARDGWLADIHGWHIQSDLDLSGVKSRAGDFVERDLARAVEASDVDAVAARTWSERCRGARSLFFCVDKQHAHRFSDRLRGLGGKVATILDDTPARDRAAAIELFGAGELEGLVNVAIATEGFDAPELQNVHILRPTKSRALYTQMLGRGTRKTLTKSSVEVFDYAGQRHDVCAVGQIFGLPDSWDLRGQSVAHDADRLDEIEAELGLKIDGATGIQDLVGRVKGRRLDLIRATLEDSGLPGKFAWMRPSGAVERWVISWRNETREGLARVPEQYRGSTEAIIAQHNLWGTAERVEIFRNELGRYEATLHWGREAVQASKKLDSLPSLSRLVAAVEARVKAMRPHKIALLLKNKAWRQQPSTVPQRDILRRKGVPEEILGELTKGEASSLINVPNATVQRWFQKI